MKMTPILRRFLSGRSSNSDRNEYLSFCDLASKNEDVFANFKRQRVYNRILEHVTKQQGAAYLARVLNHYPNLIDSIPKFKENDICGKPKKYSYGSLGEMSPTTLRYVNVLGDLLNLFGNLADFDIVEIGGGYGGQCKIIASYCGFRSYALVDLEPCLRLANKYLSKHHIKDVQYRTMDELTTSGKYDLVVSNYAFSECIRNVQEVYFKKVISIGNRGYMICNVISPAHFNSFTKDELVRRIPGSRAYPEDPLLNERNFIIAWGAIPSVGGSPGNVKGGAIEIGA